MNSKKKFFSRETLDANFTLEEHIGLYWLSKLGIAFLVVGVALLIVYSFNNFGPAAKIATGFVVSSLLMWAAEYLEKRDNIPWYARLLEGGAWALGYFTTYAMYHVQSVKLINDPLVNLALLMGVAGLAIGQALRKNSEVMAICAVSLGFITLILSTISGFSIFAAGILTAVSVILSLKKNWHRLFYYSIFASYGSFIANECLSLGTQSLPLAGAVHDTVGLAFHRALMMLTPCLIGFSLVPVFLKTDDPLKKDLKTVAAMANALAFCALFFPRAYSALGTALGIANLVFAAWFFFVGFLSHRSGSRLCASLYSLLALTVGNCYFLGAHVGQNSLFYLAAEILLLVWSGLRFNLTTFRHFALALSVIVLSGNAFTLMHVDVVTVGGANVPFCLLSNTTAIIALAVSAFLLKRAQLTALLSAQEKNIAFYTYANMAMVLAFYLPWKMADITSAWISCSTAHLFWAPILIGSWAALSASLLTVAAKLKNKYFLALSIFVQAAMAFPACSPQHFAWLPSACAAVFMLGSAFLIRRVVAGFCEENMEWAFDLQFAIASICCALLPLASGMDLEKTAVCLAVQGLAAMLTGIFVKDSFVRLMAAFAFFAAGITAFSQPLLWWSVAPVAACLYAAYGLCLLKGNYAVDSVEAEIRHLYSCLAAALLTTFVGKQMLGTMISAGWAVEALLMLAAGFLLREKVLRFTALFIFLPLGLRVLFIDLAAGHLAWWYVALISASFYAAWALYSVNVAECVGDEREASVKDVFCWCAALIAALLLGTKLQHTWTSCAWAVQGFVLLGAGFALREKQMRITGLTVFAAVVAKLFFIDLAGAPTVYRIFAFIVTGLVLLVSAYGYTIYTRRTPRGDGGEIDEMGAIGAISDYNVESNPT